MKHERAFPGWKQSCYDDDYLEPDPFVKKAGYYSFTGNDLRILAKEFQDDLAATYEAMRDQNISPSELRELESRRRDLLHTVEGARILAVALDRVSR